MSFYLKSYKRPKNYLKEQSPNFQFLKKTFGDSGMAKNLIFSYSPCQNAIAEKCSVWKELIKMCLVMVTIIKQSKIYMQLQYTKLLPTSKRLERSNLNFKLTFLV